MIPYDRDHAGADNVVVQDCSSGKPPCVRIDQDESEPLENPTECEMLAPQEVGKGFTSEAAAPPRSPRTPLNQMRTSNSSRCVKSVSAFEVEKECATASRINTLIAP